MTLQTLEREVSKIRIDRASNPVYSFLIERFPPRAIRNKSEHAAYNDLAATLMRTLNKDCDERAAEGIRRYLGVLVPFISQFEKLRWPKNRTSGREILAFLMEEHGLTQGDLGKEIGAQPYVSEILKGKKNLTALQIAKLAKRFGVSPAVFFEQ